MQAVILAGGLGSRLRPFTEVIPKPLLPLGEKSILEVQLRSLKQAGVVEAFLATNYKSDFIEAFVGDGSQYGFPVRVSREEQPLGTCGPLTLLKEQLTAPFVVMNGDILTKLDFRKFYRWSVERDAVFTVATKVITTPFRFGNVSVGDENTIIGVDEKPEFTLEVVAGIYSMKPEVFEFIPSNTRYGMDNLIKDLISRGEPVARYLINEYWIDIGQVDDYSTARDEYQKHFEDKPGVSKLGEE